MEDNNAIQTVSLTALHDLPVHSRVISRKLAKNVSAHIKSNKEYDIAPIHARRIDDKIYPITDFETIIGAKSRGIENIPVIIKNCNSMNAILADHIDQSLRPQAIDPLKIHEMVEYIVSNNKDMDIEKACKVLCLNRRPDLNNVAHISITKEAKKILSEMLDELAEKIFFVVMPIHYVKTVGKVIPEDQAKLSSEIKALTISHCSSDGHLVWPTNDMLKETVTGFKRIGKTKPVEERVASMGDKKELGKKQTKTSGKKPDKRTVAKASKFIAEDPQIMYVPVEGDHPDLLINKKTGRIAKAEENNETYTMSDDLGQVTHLLPDKVTKFLDIDTENNMETLHIRNYTSIEKAIKSLSKSKDQDARCTVISRGLLPQK